MTNAPQVPAGDLGDDGPRIIRVGDPVLRQVACALPDPGDPALLDLARLMVHRMREARGVGLAAPQLGLSLRMIVFWVPPERAEEAEAEPVSALINPVLEPVDEDIELGWEGCLSIPGLRGQVPRFKRIRYRGYDLTGAAVERVAMGFHARVVQHEVDHLDGILYLDRMRDMTSLGFVEESVEAERARERAEERGRDAG